MKIFNLLFIHFILITLCKGQGIIAAHDYVRDYLRLLEIQGETLNNPIVVHANQFELRLPDSLKSNKSNVWNDQMKYYRGHDREGLTLTLISPIANTNYSTKYARSYNDGPSWNGKGLTIGINAGFKINWGPVTGVFYPNFSFSQNRSFQLQENLQNRSEFNYQLDPRIDWVQRYGNNSFKQFHLGQSSLSVKAGKVQFKLSTENMWWGPNVTNSTLMSNNAPGFTHVNIGTPLPIQTKFGDFEINSFWGRLEESNYFDNIENNNGRYLAALTFGYRPSFSEFFKGFSLGLSRVLYQIWPESGLSFGDLFLGVKNFSGSAVELPGGGFTNDETDQMVSINTRWYFEEVGAEIYYEYARNDFWLNFKDLVQEPDHGAVFTLGVQKTFSGRDALWRIGFEHTSLATTRTIEIRSSHSIYLHSIVTQGYTHKGQLIGAPIGPASKSQMFRLDKFNKSGKVGFRINRIRFDNDYVIAESQRTGVPLDYDVELSFDLEAVRFFKNYEFSCRIIYSRRRNWHFEEDLDVNNFQILTGVKWQIRNKPLITI